MERRPNSVRVRRRSTAPVAGVAGRCNAVAGGNVVMLPLHRHLPERPERRRKGLAVGAGAGEEACRPCSSGALLSCKHRCHPGVPCLDIFEDHPRLVPRLVPFLHRLPCKCGEVADRFVSLRGQRKELLPLQSGPVELFRQSSPLLQNKTEAYMNIIICLLIMCNKLHSCYHVHHDGRES